MNIWGLCKRYLAPNMWQKLESPSGQNFCTLPSGQVGVCWAVGVGWWLEMWSCKAVRHLGLACLRCGVRSPNAFRPPPPPTTVDLHRPTLPWCLQRKARQGQPSCSPPDMEFLLEESGRDPSNIMVIRPDAANDQMTRIDEDSL